MSDEWPQPWMEDEWDVIVDRRNQHLGALRSRGWLWRLFHRKKYLRALDSYLHAERERDKLLKALGKPGYL